MFVMSHFTTGYYSSVFLHDMTVLLKFLIVMILKVYL